MTPLTPTAWRELNDAVVSAGVGWVRALLAARVPPPPASPQPARRGWLARWLLPDQPAPAPTPADPAPTAAADELAAAAARLTAAGGTSTLDRLARQFGLSAFEMDMVRLALAFELDSRVGRLCAAVQDVARPYPTFGLAMTLFDDPDWLAVSPDRPLRACRLVSFRPPPGTPLVAAEVRLEESVLHFLRGVASLDERLAAIMSAVPAPPEPTPAQVATIERLTAAGRPSLVQLFGANDQAKAGVAAAAARATGWRLYRLGADALPTAPAEVEELARLWNREGLLHGLALLVDLRDGADPGRAAAVRAFARAVLTPLYLLVREPIRDVGVPEVYADVPGPTPTDRAATWGRVLPKGMAGRERLVGELAWQFHLDPPAAADALAAVSDGSAPLPARLWQECRTRTRPRLDGLADRIECKAGWNDLVLPDDRRRLLEQVRNQVRNRWRVYDQWGVGGTMNRGLGVSALFAGDSGTGKTMAAEVLARDLGLDLYRVDLSAVVDKYIGETEKHLRRLFDAFDACGAILFFDECDALFGKRTEVKDSHDRFANIEINYLLQRLESYRGLAVLATNKRSALDPAFLRRLRFVVSFAPPTPAERKQLWQKALPPAGPRHRVPVAALDYDRLAQFALTGGNIHSVALNAMFRAADRDAPVGMADVLAAVRDEFVKLERPVHESEFHWTATPAARTEVAA